MSVYSLASRRSQPGPPVVCVIVGDDSAPEVMRPTVEILRALVPDIRFVEALSGREAVQQYGGAFPDVTRRAIDEADCTLFGASGGPSRLVLWYLRWGKETFVNIRPVRWWPGFRGPMRHPERIDYVIVRDNLEGMYPPREGDIAELGTLTSSGSWWQAPPVEKTGAYAVRVSTDEQAQRVAQAAASASRPALATERHMPTSSRCMAPPPTWPARGSSTPPRCCSDTSAILSSPGGWSAQFSRFTRKAQRSLLTREETQRRGSLLTLSCIGCHRELMMRYRGLSRLNWRMWPDAHKGRPYM